MSFCLTSTHPSMSSLQRLGTFLRFVQHQNFRSCQSNKAYIQSARVLFLSDLTQFLQENILCCQQTGCSAEWGDKGNRAETKMTMRAVWCCLLLAGTAMAGQSDPVAETPLGKARGFRMTSRGGREFLAFAGLPFARPPVGHLAFQSPQPALPWNGIREAKTNGNWCIQYNLYEVPPAVFGDQDCLYLNVYTHNLKGKNPVMLHLHGGGFISGNGPNKTGPQFLMDEDVVIVDINYRVGIFGFLSFEDREMPGNQGLKDQVMALRWVKENIASFGGDPNLVTIVGESAGAGSVYHHTLSPLSKGLFHRAIAESGTSYGLWALAPEGFTRKISMKLLKLLDIPYTSTSAAVESLRSKDPKVVAAQLEAFREWQIDPIFSFGPVLEPDGADAFLTGPVSSWRQISSVPLLMGMTSAEGLLRAGYLLYFNTTYEWLTENFEKIAPISLLYFASASNPDKISKAVKEFYFPNNEITENDWRNIVQMYTDSWFTNAVLDGANKYSGSVHFYYFDYVGDQSFNGDAATRNDTINFGAAHTEEIIYIWWNKFFKPLQGEDLKLSKKLVKIWTDFAKYGDPGKHQGLHWQTWTPEKNRYMEINKQGFHMKEGGLFEKNYKFWNSIPYRDNYK